jgi:hypothetical protein
MSRREVEVHPPSEIVDAADRELTKQGRSRRSVLRFLLTAAGTGVAFVAGVEGTLQFLKRIGVYDPDADQRLLQRLFGVGIGQTGALIPAANHPFKPPDRAPWYPIEGDCCAAYRQRFLNDLRLTTVNGYPRIKPDDNIVVFGSQVSNLMTRGILGNPWRDKARLSINGQGWRTSLRWNLHSPSDAALIERKQFGSLWVSKNHSFVGSEGDVYRSSAPRGDLEDDYLLVTSLPRQNRGSQRSIIFAAGHGPGQKAASTILATPPIKELEKVEKQIGGEPYYQALFYIPLRKDDTGEFCPKDVQLVKASKLEVAFI